MLHTHSHTPCILFVACFVPVLYLPLSAADCLALLVTHTHLRVVSCGGHHFPVICTHTHTPHTHIHTPIAHHSHSLRVYVLNCLIVYKPLIYLHQSPLFLLICSAVRHPHKLPVQRAVQLHVCVCMFTIASLFSMRIFRLLSTSWLKEVVLTSASDLYQLVNQSPVSLALSK